MNELPKHLLGLIDLKSFRNRPGMYLGSKDINVFKGFINGYIYSNECHNINDETDNLFESFRNWLAVKLNQPNTTGGWNHIILHSTNGKSDQAVDRFFDLFDEFRRIN